MKTPKKILLSLLLLTLIIMTGCKGQTTDNYQIPEDEKIDFATQFDDVEEESDDDEGITNEENPVAVIETSMGTITAELFADKVPNTVDNFVQLANDKKYDGVIFHRVIPGFMIQTGDFENNNGTGGYSAKGPGTLLDDEFNSDLNHNYGVLSMANRGPNTNGSQFFIVQAEEGTPWLDGMHSVFGNVIEGMDVVEEIAAAETTGPDKPVTDIVIESITIQ